MYDRAIIPGINAYDGYLGKLSWENRENYSTYYDFMVDKQCTVPIRNIEEVKKELETRYPEMRDSHTGS